MTQKELQKLQPGDVVRNLGDSSSMVVISNDGRTVTAVRAVTITNPNEWLRIRSSK